MNIIRIILEYSSCFCEIALSMFFFSAFKEKRFSNTKMLCIVTLIGFIYGTFVGFVPIKNGIFLFSILATIAVSFCYKFKWYVSLLLSLILSVISGLFELVVMQIITYGGTDFDTANSNIYVYIIGLASSKMLTFFIIILIRKSGHKSFQSVKNMRFIGLSMLPLTTIIISMSYSQLMFSYEINDFWKTSSIVALILLIISNIMIFYIVDKQYELISAKEKLKTSKVLLESQKQYYDDVFQSQQEIRKTRHDLKNIFIALLSELNTGNLDKAKKMIQRKLSETEQYIDIDCNSDNVIDTILHSKIAYAKENNISLTVKKSIDRPILIDSLDIVVLIANILDNAIEATNQTSGEKQITFSIITDNDNLIILSKNPTLNIIDFDKLITTKKDKRYHGFGVLSIKSITDKYDGSYIFECENGVFTSTAILNNRK